eukprot:TRINITY_DN74855_c0_g1_i1.p1 TRINITY_DN74855_c0_g1~~TRINITY_DN74855_c0_g1_i1.p1  ORF type:complete len:264 (-),score=47.37 TRINITY_DN74855_c0_g1_i1:46-837(-)
MPLEVIGAGFGRTGTMSLQAALNILYGPKERCYHFGSIMEEGHIDLWNRIIYPGIGRKADGFDTIFKEGYVATMDHPCCNYYEEFMELYPEAKVLLSVHPGGLEKWWKSKEAHSYTVDAFNSLPISPLARFVVPIVSVLVFRKNIVYSFRDVMNFVRSVERLTFGERSARDRDNAVEIVEAWNERVKKVVPKDKLLVYDVSQGWEPLCRFLGKPVPDEPFPKEDMHGSDALKSLVLKVRAVVVCIYAFAAYCIFAGARKWLST